MLIESIFVLYLTTSVIATDSSVIIVGVDGLASRFAQSSASFSSLTKRADVSYTFDARTTHHTISEHGWRAVLQGSIGSAQEWQCKNCRNIPVLTHVLNELPNASTAIIDGWTPIRWSAGHTTIPPQSEQDSDRVVTRFEALNMRSPYVAILHMNAVDHAGHTYKGGWGGTSYMKEVDNAAAAIKRLITLVRNTSTTIIVTADHGGVGDSHGIISRKIYMQKTEDLDSPNYLHVPLLVFWSSTGSGAFPLGKICRHGVFLNSDVPAITAYALNITAHPSWRYLHPTRDLFVCTAEDNVDLPAGSSYQSSPNWKLGFIITMVLLIVCCLLAGVFGFLWFRKRRH